MYGLIVVKATVYKQNYKYNPKSLHFCTINASKMLLFCQKSLTY